MSGRFCHKCGQETVLHPPSTREFLHEFIGHYVALEGKLWKSLGLLLFRPGRLTLEYIKGRRVRYVQPLRLYLSFSLIFFAVMKYNGHDGKAGETKAGQEHPVAASAERARARDSKPGLVEEDRPGEFRSGTQWIHESLGRYSPRLATAVGDKVEHFGHLSRDEKGKVITAAFYSYVPYAIFFMVPQGFGLLKFLLWLWLAFYLPTAMRRVYGGWRTVTALRWIVLMLLHLLTLSLAVVAALAFGVLH